MFSYIFWKNNGFIRTFRRIFPFAVVPQIFMLFYAIYLRINQYDLTINRYFIVAFWIWLLWISLYYVFSKKKKLIYIPLTLSVMSVLISIWPWWVYSLPESRQLERLESNLKQAWIILVTEELYWYDVAQSIIPLADYSNISPELSKEIYGWIEYLCKLDNCNTIKNLFPKIYADYLQEHKQQFEDQQTNTLELGTFNNKWFHWEDEYQEPRSWEIVSHITSILQVRNYFEATLDQEFIHVSLDYSQSFFPINTQWYAEIHEIRGDRDIPNMAYLNVEDANITLPNGEVYDITSILNELVNIYNTPGIENPLKDPTLLQFELEKAKIYIRNVNLKNPNFTWEKSEFPYYGAQWYILIP